MVSRGLLLDYCLNGCVSDRRIAHVDPAVTNKLLSSVDLAGCSNIQLDCPDATAMLPKCSNIRLYSDFICDRIVIY